MSNAVLLYTIQLIAITSAILLALGYLRANPRQASVQVFALGACGIVLYILEGMAGPHIDPLFQVDISPWPWRLIVHPAVQAVPGLFMIYSFLVFQEERRFPPALLMLFLIQVIFEAIVLLPEGDIDLFIPDQIRASMNGLQLIFVGCALYWTLKGWRDDLVQDRRLQRWLAISLQGFLVFCVVVVENFLIANGVIDVAQAKLLLFSAIAVILVATLLITMKPNKIAPTRREQESGGLLNNSGSEKEQEKEKTPAPELNPVSFERLFLIPRLYRQSGLTISGLADQLNLPEYRLREFIHTTLGHRNFNVMLHHYRIADASELLSDPENCDSSVLNIALAVGYQSTTSFNNAFREIKGETPTVYRRRMVTLVAKVPQAV